MSITMWVLKAILMLQFKLYLVLLNNGRDILLNQFTAEE